MDSRRVDNIEDARLDASNDDNMHAQETPYGISTDSTPLLSSSMANSDDSSPAEQQGTDGSELQAIPHALLKGLFLFFISMLPYIAIMASWIYLINSESDPLGLAFLSFLLLSSLALSLLVIALLVCAALYFHIIQVFVATVAVRGNLELTQNFIPFRLL
jgi:hypothetical protein